MSEMSTAGAEPRPPVAAVSYRAGDLYIDVGRQRVTRGDSVIALPKLSYELLMALVRAAPNLVSLDTLMEQVWPKAVVSPETLSQRVKLLRDALGDDPRAPRYIEGLRGRGYRLIPAVEKEAAGLEIGAIPHGPAAPVPAPSTPAAPAPDTGSAAATPPDSRRPRLRAFWVGILVATVFGGAWLIRHLMHPQPATPRHGVEVVAVQAQAVAVLPFDNLSSEPGNDFIALGLADAVLNELASVPELIVVARSSSFALGKPTPDAREAGRRLGVRYLVTGSVQRAGKVLRVTAQLTDTTTNVALWSLKLDRTIDDVFALQDQIAQRVAQQLDVTLEGRSARYAQYGTDAYLAFLKGRALIESRTLKDVEESIRQFSRAIELAPKFAAAIAELARAKWQLVSLQPDPEAYSAQHRPEIEALVNRAIQIDPTAGEAYFLRASFARDRGDLSATEADFRKGLDLAPSFGPGLREYAEYLESRGRTDEALEQYDRARRVDPLSAENHYHKGEALRFLYRYDEAAALYLQALSVQPDFYPAYTRLATVRWERGRLAEAIRYGEKSIAIEPTVDWTRERLIWFYVDAGDLPAARDVLRGYVPGAIDRAAPEALICYRAGKLERAIGILRPHLHDPDLRESGFAFFISVYAVVEHSIASGDPSAARQFILEIPRLKKAGAELELSDDDFPENLQLATVEHEVGDKARASAQAQRILDYLDRAPNIQMIAGWDEWARAAASAILGREDAALGHLENLLRSGYRVGWWARIERDPAFTAMHPTPRFRAVVADSKRWLENETQQLAQMRQHGDVPRRAAVELTPGGC